MWSASQSDVDYVFYVKSKILFILYVIYFQRGVGEKARQQGYLSCGD